MPTFKNVKKKDLDFLKKLGYGETEKKTEYDKVRMKGDCSLILYTSGKLVIQGKNSDKLVKLLKNNKLELVEKIEFVKEEGIVIGSDEVLKGDTFGGLVVAGVKANERQRQDLLFAGVMDSKKLKDSDIMEIAPRIKKIAEYSVKEVMPKEYNKYQVTPLMNKLHNEVHKELGKGDLNVVDKYPGCNVDVYATTKAESKYVEVAAASILAREAAINQLKILSEKLNYNVPKGSTHVKEGLEELYKSGKKFEEFVKIDFNNVKTFISQKKKSL